MREFLKRVTLGMAIMPQVILIFALGAMMVNMQYAIAFAFVIIFLLVPSFFIFGFLYKMTDVSAKHPSWLTIYALSAIATFIISAFVAAYSYQAN